MVYEQQRHITLCQGSLGRLQKYLLRALCNPAFTLSVTLSVKVITVSVTCHILKLTAKGD